MVDDHQAGTGELARQRVGQQRVLRLRGGGVGVNQHHHAVQVELRLGFAQLRNAPGVGHTAGLHHHGVQSVGVFEHLDQGHGEVVANLAAHAAVAQGDGVAGGAFNQTGVNVEGAKVVHQHGQPLPVGVAQPVVEQRGFARAKKTANHGQGKALLHGG